MKCKILVTGATGNIGAALMYVLRTRYRNFEAIGSSHRHLDGGNLKFVELDYDNSDKVEQALAGIDYLFFVPSHSQHRAEQAFRVMQAAKRCNIKYVVCVSLLGSESRVGLFCSQFKDIEECVEQSGIPWTVLQCSPLQQNMLALQDNFKQPIGTIAMPTGTGGYSPIHVNDVASVAGILFSNPRDHYSKVYRLTGPEVLSGRLINAGVSIAGKASQGLGRPVRFVNCSRVEAREAMLRASSPEWVVDGFLELYDLIAKGFFATLSPDLANLTFDKGVTVEEFFRMNKILFNTEIGANVEQQDIVLPSKL